MNFFRDKELAERFAADKVAEKEIFFYFLISGIIVSLFTSTSFITFLEIEVTIWDYITDVILIVTSIIGSIWVYRINAKGDNRNFVARYISLSFPIGVKCLMLLVIYMFLLGITVVLNEEMFNKTLLPTNAEEIFFVVGLSLIILYSYFRLAYAMKIASRPTGN